MSCEIFDISSVEFKQNPHPMLARMVAAGPVVKVRYPLIGTMWAVTQFATASELLRDRQRFPRDPVTGGLKKGSNLPWWFPRSLRPLARTMINRDEPDHRRLRSLVEQAFLRRNIEELKPWMINRIAELLGELEYQQSRSGCVDLISGLAYPFPLAVICELLGLPEKDRPLFVRQAEAFAGKMSWKTMWKVFPAIKGLNRYIGQQIADCRRKPRPGLITSLVEAEEQGERLTEEEMISMIMLLLLAGHVTTVHLIGGGIHTLLKHPALIEEVSQTGELSDACVEELLRYLSPVQSTKPMLVSQDMVWHGVQLKRGEKIVAFLAAANADPERFAQPGRFDPGRDEQANLAFGAGIHNCLGTRLAKAEGSLAIGQLLAKFPGIRLAGNGNDVVYVKQTGMNGLERLNVVLRSER